MKKSIYPPFKRLGDFVLSLVGLIVLSPLILLLALLIKLDSKGPIFFMQKRVGLNKSHFMIYKFRTMCTDTPKDMPTHMLQDPSRFITRMGAFLRRTSLDELPQLFNIIKGDMAVVGPRPALWNQYDLIAERDANGSNKIRPGLTGWAQINGRDELPIKVKAQLDGVYVEKMGLMMDVKIFLLTILVSVSGKGMSEGANT